ncbi:MAG: hypothetical protein PVI21_06230 [Candidatus Woesebacteria bacterium]|jgi:hypothetical protein
MKGRNTITINGRLYDAVSGMPVVSNEQRTNSTQSPQSIQRNSLDITAPAKRTVQSDIHMRPQRSKTLHRAALTRPAIASNSTAQQTSAKPQIQRSPAISKFGNTLQQAASAPQNPNPKQINDEPPQAHPVVAKALQNIEQRQAPQKPEQVQSSKELKEALIKERLSEVDKTERKQPKKSKNPFKRSRLSAVATSALSVLLLGGYLTYLNLPNISMRVAATHAGVAANLPSYQPAGYSFNGPITYSPGEVAINYNSKDDDKNYTVKQKSSNWNSQAVLDNYILKQTDSYLTYQEKGLTIYSYDNKAAWVNGGILYTIEGNTALSGEQVLSIATSM